MIISLLEDKGVMKTESLNLLKLFNPSRPAISITDKPERKWSKAYEPDP
jgi:hypothetical protein